MARSKLNKITKLHLQAQEDKEGSDSEMEESAQEQKLEDEMGTEQHPEAAAKARRAKKLDFNENRGGMRVNIYKSK